MVLHPQKFPNQQANDSSSDPRADVMSLLVFETFELLPVAKSKYRDVRFAGIAITRIREYEALMKYSDALWLSHIDS